MRNGFNYYAAKGKAGQAGFSGKAARSARKSFFQEKQRAFSKDPIFRRNDDGFTPQKNTFTKNTESSKSKYESLSVTSKARVQAARGARQPDEVGTSRSNFFTLSEQEKKALWEQYNSGTWTPYEGDSYREEGELIFI